jgi:hypothetical protein
VEFRWFSAATSFCLTTKEIQKDDVRTPMISALTIANIQNAAVAAVIVVS